MDIGKSLHHQIRGQQMHGTVFNQLHDQLSGDLAAQLHHAIEIPLSEQLGLQDDDRFRIHRLKLSGPLCPATIGPRLHQFEPAYDALTIGHAASQFDLRRVLPQTVDELPCQFLRQAMDGLARLDRVRLVPHVPVAHD